MKTLTNPRTATAVIVACIAVVFIANTSTVFGRFISKVFPCDDEIGMSMPCSAKYDIAIMAIAATVGVTFLIPLGRRLFWAPDV